MDEPCSALDPIATGIIEELIRDLAQNYAIVIVTHSMAQARRVSQRTAFFYRGDLEEVDPPIRFSKALASSGRKSILAARSANKRVTT